MTHPPAALCYCRGDERRQLARYYSAQAKCVAEFQSPESQNERLGKSIEATHNDITKCICFRKSFGGWWEARWLCGNVRDRKSLDGRFEPLTQEMIPSGRMRTQQCLAQNYQIILEWTEMSKERYSRSIFPLPTKCTNLAVTSSRTNSQLAVDFPQK